MVTSMETPSRAPDPTPPARQTLLALVVSVAGSALGTWLAAELTTDPVRRLVGAVLGALVPAVLSELLSRGRTRPAVALLLAAVAAALIYVTVTARDVATQRPATFPVPAAVPVPTAPPAPPAQPAPTPPDTVSNAHGDAVPSEVSCTADGCSGPVVLRNLGNVPITVTYTEFSPDGGGFDVDRGCEQRTLGPGDECTVEVSWTPSAGTEDVQLVIHQDLPGDPWYVTLRGEGPATPSSTAPTSTGPPTATTPEDDSEGSRPTP
jgi:hypothetical protein